LSNRPRYSVVMKTMKRACKFALKNQKLVPVLANSLRRLTIPVNFSNVAFTI